ncbi:MAG: hypothetical protein WDO16_24575 [Bacteroidota bacterium]
MLLPLAGFSQGYINLSKKQVRRALTKQVSANDTINILLTETDTSLHYSVRDIKMSAADFIYLFDKKNKCNAEIVIAGCDSCFTKYLQKAVTQQNTGWKKLKENMYISKFSKKMLLEIPANNTPHSFIIRRMKWDKQIYQTLLTSK